MLNKREHPTHILQLRVDNNGGAGHSYPVATITEAWQVDLMGTPDSALGRASLRA